MPTYAIVIDTDASLPLELIERYHIYQVPQTVVFGNESFEAVYQIDDATLFSRIDREGKLPTTAAPPPGKFAAAFQAAFDDGAEGVICFCVSSQVSATFESARNACELLPGRDITVVDSRTLTIGQGFMVLEAAEAAYADQSKEEILALAENVRERTHLFAAVPTLKYLAMSGRMSQIASGVANILDIKPILTIKDGRLVLLERVRAWHKSLRRIIELAEKARAGQPIERMAIGHVNVPEEARRFQNQVFQELPCPEEVIFTEINPGMSPHSGAGVVGMGFVTAARGK